MATKKQTKPKPKKSKGNGATSAAEIKKLEQEAKQEPLVLQPLTRSVQEIVRDRATILDGGLGLELSDNTTIEESLAVLDWAQGMSDHVGFWIGDILNFANTKWGQKYTVALQQTNRALSTLKGYAEAAKRIPANKRVAALTFTAHREILRLPDAAMEKTLVEVGKQAEKGEAPTTKQIREKVKKSLPRKVKKVKATKPGKKKAKPEPPPYQPDAEEQPVLDGCEEALTFAAEMIKSNKLFQLVGKLDNKEKKRWVAMAQPIVDFYNAVDRVTGYN